MISVEIFSKATELSVWKEKILPPPPLLGLHKASRGLGDGGVEVERSGGACGPHGKKTEAFMDQTSRFKLM